MHVHNLCKLKLKRKLLQSPAETFITLFSLTDSARHVPTILWFFPGLPRMPIVYMSLTDSALPYSRPN